MIRVFTVQKQPLEITKYGYITKRADTYLSWLCALMKYTIYLAISYTTFRENNISDDPRLLSHDNVMP